MDYRLTEHARDALEKRRIPLEWMERALTAPEWVEQDAVDPTLEHRIAHIAEFGGRAIRVIVNCRVSPLRIVTVYFDRRARDR